MSDNRGMGHLCLVLAILMPLLSACVPQREPSHPTTAVSSSHAPSPRLAAAEKPAAKAKAPQPPRLRDDFNLPLVIKMEVPETPPEIRKPSPPIQEPTKSP